MENSKIYENAHTINVIKNCKLFEGIKEENLFSLLNCLQSYVKTFSKDETIFAEGSESLNLGIVLSGSVKIIRNDIYGNRTIVAHIEESGIFGESFACARTEHIPVSVVASSDTTLMLIKAARITNTCCNACSFHSQIIFNLLHVIAQKNIVFNEKLEIVSNRTTREKLLSYLMIQAKKNDSKNFTIPYNRQELADYLQVERSGLSVEISKLKKDGLITCHKNYFSLK